MKPYIINLREIMLFFNISNEASLFAGDQKQDDDMVSLRKKVSQAKTRYAARLDAIRNEAIGQDANAKVNLAVALYLATYFDANQSCR